MAGKLRASGEPRKAEKEADRTRSVERTMTARAWISTTTFSKAYLLVAWKSRDQLKEYERRGFAQFFYLTICGHVEGLLASVIKSRLHSINMLRWYPIPPMQVEDGDTVHSCPFDPVVESMERIISTLGDEIDSAPLAKLIELHSKVFPQALSDIVGSDLHQDLLALAYLRNLFAHGRDLFMKFDNAFAGKATLDKNPLQLPAQRLQAAKIIKDFNITGQNYNDFQAVFFGDEALLYFYRAVQDIEKKLRAFCTFLPETRLPTFPTLPDLDA